MLHVIGALGIMVSSSAIGMDKTAIEVVAIAAEGEKKGDAIETDEGCRKFAGDLLAFKYAKYKTAGRKTLTLGSKESADCEFDGYTVRVAIKGIAGDKVKVALSFYKGKEEVGKQTVTVSAGGKSQITEITEGKDKATIFALTASGG